MFWKRETQFGKNHNASEFIDLNRPHDGNALNGTVDQFSPSKFDSPVVLLLPSGVKFRYSNIGKIKSILNGLNDLRGTVLC